MSARRSSSCARLPPLPDRWAQGRYKVTLRLFGLIPLGRQEIAVSFPPPPSPFTHILQDQGHSALFPSWDHQIQLAPGPQATTLYTDRLRIRARLATPLALLALRLFFTWRQARLRDLVRNRLPPAV